MVVSAVILYPAVAVFTTALAGVCVWFKRPGLILYGILRYFLYSTGLRLKFIRAGEYKFCYAERGTKNDIPSLLLVHGFSASKDMWVPIVKKLPKNKHVIVIDLPGHGESSIPDDSHDISLPKYAEYLHQFVEAVGLDDKPFHLAGTSMGGLIAALYASQYTQYLHKLTLICPAMRTPEETDFQREMRNGINCRLIPKTVEETQTMMDSCSFTKSKFNKQILKAILELRTPKTPYYERLLSSILSLERSEEGKELEAKVWNNCTVPTQIIWGKQDEIIHVSGVDLLQERLPDLIRVDLIDNCGHTCNMERPGLVSKYITEFMEDNKKSN